MKPFTYGNSRKIIYWGCSFDSLLELKFALSIQDEYEFLRSRISVYYDPKTRLPTRYIRGNTRRYTPDFLIRHKQSLKAFWVEIKPRAFNNEQELLIRREVAENYIREHNFDWEYKVIYDDEIKLNLDQLAQFNECCSHISQSARKLTMEKINRKYDRSAAPLFTRVLPGIRVQFIMFGNNPPPSHTDQFHASPKSNLWKPGNISFNST
ncbi:MAG: TnsA endonuclease N-terminal domain-containing protein [Sphingobacteriales bacterium]|nr:TnsA endonuclease N-terminal domain-containing protein [Sphingobacteriales bacterium]